MLAQPLVRLGCAQPFRDTMMARPQKREHGRPQEIKLFGQLRVGSLRLPKGSDRSKSPMESTYRWAIGLPLPVQNLSTDLSFPAHVALVDARICVET
jgi:hypothetical protein